MHCFTLDKITMKETKIILVIRDFNQFFNLVSHRYLRLDPLFLERYLLCFDPFRLEYLFLEMRRFGGSSSSMKSKGFLAFLLGARTVAYERRRSLSAVAEAGDLVGVLSKEIFDIAAAT